MEYDFSQLHSRGKVMYYGDTPLKRATELGGARPKFMLGEYIVKMDGGTWNAQSSAEVALQEILEDSDKQFFAPIVYGRRYESREKLGFIVQPKLQIATYNLTQEAEEVLEELVCKYDLDDASGKNVAMLEDGRFMILDYGLSELHDEIREDDGNAIWNGEE